MAQIIINEISDNYTFNIGNNAFATVALPLTACWGPAALNPDSVFSGATQTSDAVERFTKVVNMNKWQLFPATPQGLEAFVSTYRGPSSAYKVNKDYSYQMATTLLTAGYDVLVYRACNGGPAAGEIVVQAASADPVKPKKSFTIGAKYAGSFGNNIKVQLTGKSLTVNNTQYGYWNMVVYVVGTTGSSSAVENINFVVAEPTAYDLPDYISVLEDVTSDFITIANSVTSETATAPVADADALTYTAATTPTTLAGGTDETAPSGTVSTDQAKAMLYLGARYNDASPTGTSTDTQYGPAVNTFMATADATSAQSTINMEFNYTVAYFAYKLLQDKLMYAPNRIISPGWDDENVTKFTGAAPASPLVISPMHRSIMRAAYYGRCGAGMLDIPLSVTQENVKTYATLLSQETSPNPLENNAPLYVTNSALFVNWGQYRLAGMSKMVHVNPAFLDLLIWRAQLLGQSVQYEWLLPTNKKHNLNIGKLDHEYTKTILDAWQDIEGVSVNILTNIPGQGIICWGNSTLFNVPPATYQALANLSTRFLMNAVENQVFITSLGITFTYNNAQALSSYVVGVSPILDTMKSAGAIEGYKIVANPDINGEDHVNAQTILARVYMAINGSVNDIVTDIYALPPTADLSQFGA